MYDTIEFMIDVKQPLLEFMHPVEENILWCQNQYFVHFLTDSRMGQNCVQEGDNLQSFSEAHAMAKNS